MGLLKQFVVSTAFIWCFALVSAFPSHATDENETESLLKLLGYVKDYG